MQNKLFLKAADICELLEVKQTSAYEIIGNLNKELEEQGYLTLPLSLGYQNPDELPVTLATILTKVVEEETFENNLGILPHQEGIDLLPANIELSGMEVSLVNFMSRELVLKQYIEQICCDDNSVWFQC